MNVAVINLKDIFKLLIKLAIIVCTIILLVNWGKNIKSKNIKANIEQSKFTSFLKFCLNSEINLISDFNKTEKTIDISKRYIGIRIRYNKNRK